MNTENFEQIWNKHEGSDLGRTMSREEISEATGKFSSDNVSSSRKLLFFDSILKSLVLAAYVILLVTGVHTAAKIIFTTGIIACLSFLLYRNKVLHTYLTEVNEAGPVISVLRNRYDALMKFYPEFYFNSSLTNPMMVFAGFQFYMLFRYGEDRFHTLLSDPVTYLFLLLAFLIPYVAQRMTYSRMIAEMETIMEIDYTELESEMEIIRIRTSRRRRLIFFLLMSLLGLSLFLTLILISS